MVILITEEGAAGLGLGAPAVVAADTGHATVDAKLYKMPHRNVVNMTPDAAAVFVSGIQILDGSTQGIEFKRHIIAQHQGAAYLQPVAVGMVTCLLRTDIRVQLIPRAPLIQPQESRSIPVDIILNRPATEIPELVRRSLHTHPEANSGHFNSFLRRTHKVIFHMQIAGIREEVIHLQQL